MDTSQRVLARYHRSASRERFAQTANIICWRELGPCQARVLLLHRMDVTIRPCRDTRITSSIFVVSARPTNYPDTRVHELDRSVSAKSVLMTLISAPFSDHSFSMLDRRLPNECDEAQAQCMPCNDDSWRYHSHGVHAARCEKSDALEPAVTATPAVCGCAPCLYQLVVRFHQGLKRPTRPPTLEYDTPHLRFWPPRTPF